MSAAASENLGVTARILGSEPEGLAHQAVVSLLAGNGIVAVGNEDRRDGSAAAQVAVLFEPSDEDWASAQAAALPVVLVESGQTEASGVLEAVLRGADAVVHADAEPTELLAAISVVLEGGTLLNPSQVRAVAQMARKGGANPEVRLTRREAEIIESIAQGDAVKQTARTLGISAKTVENLQSRLFRKLGVQNRAQAVAQAHALGLI